MGTGVGVGAAMHAAGLSFAIGAFVAGLVLSESEFSHQALSDVVPLRDIFGLLFFVTVGMLFDPAYLFQNLGLVAAVVPCVVVGKALVFGLLARAFGYRNMAPWIVGLGLSQVGEFSFVLARTGLGSGTVSKPVYDLALTVTVVSMALAPAVSSLALPLGRAWRKWSGQQQAVSGDAMAIPVPISGHAIVGGYGRTARAAVAGLREAGVPFVVVELNHAVYGRIARDGAEGVFGDITRDEILHAAGIERAKLLLLKMPDAATAALAADAARRLHPDVFLIARGLQTAELRKHGVAVVVRPEVEGGLEIVRQALLRFESGSAEAQRIVDGLRDGFQRDDGF